ncbi:MAG: hypothetical protein D6689_06495 [Deltaproteobacteria bacterium]|nr:MAG: hypothetical protein D6689_06495 [Deltaproteobacteria bacterium]
MGAAVVTAAACDAAGAAAVGETSAVSGDVVVDIVAPAPVAPPKAAGDDGNCASGCSLKNHPVPPFTPEQFADALAAYQRQPVAADGDALDTLLFYGRRTRELIDLFGTDPLDDAHRTWLLRELSRTHARVSIRVIDEHGAVRALVDGQRVPIGIKQHLHAQVKDLQPLEFNGTVMRVGLNTVWSRY